MSSAGFRLGQVEVARNHLFYAGQQPEATELHKLQAVEKHLSKCSDFRKIGDWKSTLREADAAIAAGADYSPQVNFFCFVFFSGCNVGYWNMIYFKSMEKLMICYLGLKLSDSMNVQLFSCRAESLLKLQQLDDIDSILSNIPKVEPSPNCCSQSKFFGMLSEAYLFYVRAQIEMALGR